MVAGSANWIAAMRALESRRPDRLFDDPFAERLASERGFAANGRFEAGAGHPRHPPLATARDHRRVRHRAADRLRAARLRHAREVAEAPVTVEERRPSRTPIARRVARTVVGLVRLRVQLWRERA